jgi:beta-lactamase regulating signal transducer with metallopeptidase domain
MLSYLPRLACIALLGFGAFQMAMELILWLLCPVMDRLTTHSTARRRERVFFVAQLFPHLLALLFTSIFLVPQYLHSEINLQQERVGWLCIFFAAVVLSWHMAAASRGLVMWQRTRKLQSACQSEPDTHSDVRAVSLPDERPLLALVGLVRPRIVVSKVLLGNKSFALDIAFDHERSHARHHDNWKLFLLTCLPNINLSYGHRLTCMQYWKRYAEWAADDDAVRGSRARAILLAESLVAFARFVPLSATNIISMELAVHEEELAARVERLLHLEESHPRYYPTCLLAIVVATGTMLIGFTAMMVHAAPSLHETTEYLLHLG